MAQGAKSQWQTHCDYTHLGLSPEEGARFIWSG